MTLAAETPHHPAGETDLGMAPRHAIEAEGRVLRQSALVARLGPGGGRTAAPANRSSSTSRRRRKLASRA